MQAAAMLDRLDPRPYWTFGGGTALALRYEHRISYDVDIFLGDAQVLGFLTPRLNDSAASIADQYQESANGIKIVTANGDIDFVVAGQVTEGRPDTIAVHGIETLVETPAEILAKKIQYRGYAFAHRDIFDLAVLMKSDPAQVEAALRACTRDAVETTGHAIASRLPRLASELPLHVNPTPSYRSLLSDAADIVRGFPGVPARAAASSTRPRRTRK